MNNCQPWFYLCLALCGVLLAMLAMFFNYSLKLDARTIKLEKKNGKETKLLEVQLAELEKLKTRVKELEKGEKHE